MKFARFLRAATLLKASVWLAVFSMAHVSEAAYAQEVAPAVFDEIEGELEILHEDSDHGSRNHYFLKTKDEKLTLNFAKDPPTHLSSGSRVRVRGDRKNNFIALQSGGQSVETVAAATSSTLGDRRTLVILVNFRNDNSQPYSASFAHDIVFNTTSNFFLENSYQQTYLSGVVKGWYTIAMDRPVNAATCDVSLIASLAEQAAANAGVVVADYNHKLYAFPQSGCGWWGVSSIGGNPSQSWVNGNLDLGVTAHELGHGLGLWHSHSLDCGTNTVIGSNCTTNEYGDIVDMMGASHSAHYNAFQKERLGWLNAGASPTIRTISSTGTYMLESYESVSAGPKALKILKSTEPTTGVRTWYYIVSRKAVGFDSFLADEPSQNVLNGLLIHTGTENAGNSSHLLDMTPATPVYFWWYDPALVQGQTFTDPSSGLTLTANSVSSLGAIVDVRFALAITVSTDRSSYNRTQTVSISAMVKSNGVSAANIPVTFTVKKPNGALATGSATTANNGVAIYKLRLTKKDPVGVYEATATVSSAAAKTNFTVQ